MPVVTFAGLAHPWMCDAMGHLNVRHYVAMFDDAGFQMLGRIAGRDADPKLGWADIRMEIEYRHETPANALLTITSRVEATGRTSVTCLHEMRGTLDDVLHATMRTVTLRFDLAARSKVVLSPQELAAAEALMA